MILKIKNISFCYKSEKILNNITFEVKNAEMVAVLGKNGAGKSTLLKTIAKVLTPKRGAVYLNDEEILKLKTKEFVKKISYVSQKQQPNELNVFEMLLLGRRSYFSFRPSKKDYEEVYRVIKILGLEKIKLKPTKDLSGGELQKVAIARAIIQGSDIILLDEPTNNLDIKNQIEILKLLKTLKKTAILVLHDINLALRFCDEFIFLKDGKIAYKGDKKIITQKLIKDVYGIDVDICYYEDNPVIIPK